MGEACVITVYEDRAPTGLVVSPYVEYLLAGPADGRVWILASDPETGVVVAGLTLNLTTGRTGRDVIGASVGVADLSVDPAHQRRGIGSALMRAVETWLHGRPDLPATISLGVEPTNRAAVSVYTRLGYTVVDHGGDSVVATGSDGAPFIVMFKRLVAAP